MRTQNYDDYCMCHGGCNASIYELNGTGERSRLRRRRILKCCFAVLTRFFWGPSFGDDATHHLVSRLPYYGRPDNDPTRPDDESSAWRQEITPLASPLPVYYTHTTTHPRTTRVMCYEETNGHGVLYYITIRAFFIILFKPPKCWRSTSVPFQSGISPLLIF